jgi:hypothetical protein
MADKKQCSKCGKEFVHVSRYENHTRQCGDKDFVCKWCGKRFGRRTNGRRHEDTCKDRGKEPLSLTDLIKEIPCTAVDKTDDIAELFLDQVNDNDYGLLSAEDFLNVSTEIQAGEGEGESQHPLPDLQDPKQRPFMSDNQTGNEDTEEFVEIVNAHWGSIKTRHRCQKVLDILNIRLWDPEDDNYEANVGNNVLKAWQSFSCKAKVNASVGCILVHKTNGRFRYFHSSSNNATLLEEPRTIGSEEQMEKFVEDIASVDVAREGLLRRPNTEWILYAITNLTVYFYKLLGISRFGGSESHLSLPQHILSNRSIFALDRHPKTGQEYKDLLCFFRCLAVLSDCECTNGMCNCKSVSERTTKRLFQHYLDSMELTTDEFLGVDECDLLMLEDLFNVAIYVYSLDTKREATVIWRSKRTFPRRLNLNFHDQHFSYIRNLESYSQSYSCVVCQRCFSKSGNYNRHTCAVEEASKLMFRGGEFERPDNIFLKLERDAGIVIAQEDPLRFYPFRVTYDIESLLPKDPDNLPTNTETTTYENCHSLLSVSVCSNVPGFKQPKCFVRSSKGVAKCVSDFVAYLHKIANKAGDIMETRFK